jgi:hypothetical protein
MPHFLHSLVVIGVRGVAFLPEKFCRPQKHARAQLPSNDVGPLVYQHWQIAPALDPFGEEVADDRLRRRPNHIGLVQLLAAGQRYYCQFRRKAFDVFRLLM